MKTLFSLILISAASLGAWADVQRISPGGEQEKVADMANEIFYVATLKAGTLTYKIVSLDTKLNGDLNLTTIVLVGAEVGGAAGYESAFQLSPNDDKISLQSAEIINGEIKLSFYDATGAIKSELVHYDAAKKLLVETPLK